MKDFRYSDQREAYIRGLAAGVKENAEMGAKAERNRIIALLKDDYLRAHEYDEVRWADTLDEEDLQQIISLIEGKK